ncbi:conserved unknown protein [Ectocarpus siliculosus]|uniref:Uncharacterized protein n=1 Tax=Ectocarpus siliculosus TaxID=2880 RepID=D8LH68_ECTSI|nr:conserved unknown protein [Ectocarpus siliculosus]|eukprot:CBN74287.1 conserved unknown protein [Ectocarpus siliculosus]
MGESAQAGCAMETEDAREAPLTVTEFFLDPRRYNPSSPILHKAANADGDTALYVAAKAGHDEAVRALLEVQATKVNWQNHKGITSVSVAAHKGREEIVKMLISADADVNIDSNNGSTPLIQASHFGHAEVVKLLVNANALVDKANQKGTTALMRATQEGNEEVVGILVAAGADVSKRNNERMNALMLGSQRGHAAIVQALIHHKADIDGQTAQGSTALMLACKRGHEEVVRVLLTAGAELHQKDSRGRTARDTASKRSHESILAMLHPSKQMRLMQDAEVAERTLVLQKVFNRYTAGKLLVTETQPDVSGSASLSMLIRSLISPISSNRAVFEHIASFIPLPRLWDTSLEKIRRRCHIDATEAIREAFRIIDEVLADLNFVHGPDHGTHLVRLWEHPSLGQRLTQDLHMPPLLVQALRSWGGTQESVTSLAGGEVTFQPRVATRVVALATELVKWYRTHESSTCYIVDPDISAACANGAGSGRLDGEIEGESSDGEMDG